MPAQCSAHHAKQILNPADMCSCTSLLLMQAPRNRKPFQNSVPAEGSLVISKVSRQPCMVMRHVVSSAHVQCWQQ